MPHKTHLSAPDPWAPSTVTGLLRNLLDAITRDAVGEALARWLQASGMSTGAVRLPDGSGWTWHEGPLRHQRQDLPSSADDWQVPLDDGADGLSTHGRLPAQIDRTAIALAVTLAWRAARPTTLGNLPLLYALSQTATRSLRREDLLHAFSRQLIDAGHFDVAALLTDTGEDGPWQGCLARRGHADPDWLPDVLAPAGTDIDQWLARIPTLRQALNGRYAVTVPLYRGETHYGVLLLAGGPTGDAALVRDIATQIESALDNAAGYEAMRQSALGFKHLYDVARSFSATLDYHQAVQLIVQRMAASLALTSCSLLSLGKHGRARLEATTGTNLTNGHYIEVAGVPAFQEAIATLEPVTIGVDSAPALGMHGGLVLPLKMRQELIGLICLGEPIESPGRALTQRERQLAQTIANQAAIAMDNALLYQDMEERVIERTLELRLANADLQARQRDLELLTQQLQAIIHSIPDALVVLDPKRVVRVCNPAFGQITALSGVTMPLPMHDLVAAMGLPPEGRDALAACLEELTQQPETSLVWERTLPVVAGKATFKILTAPVINALHEAEGQVLVFHDVTRERELDQLKSDFVATVSHELRTPVSAMIGFVTLLEDGIAGPISDDQTEYLTKILAQGERLIRLIDDLLDFSKLEAGQMPVYLQLFDLSEAIFEIGEQIRPLVDAKQMVLTTDIDPDLPPVYIDPDKFRQILVNLLSNAIKFSPEHTGVIAVRATRLSPDELAIRVSDNGIGIAPQNQAKLFESFYQVDQSATRKYGGTGLGLAIVKRLVELHGGRIWLESDLDQGAAFTFTIPLPLTDTP
ncbi:MAG: GAF domain-containing protein [Candidatus Sericytochromatia bacterium]|nr:GAF domain-containing protein [Candidatus Sericytochromatia bacterium]